MIKYWFIPYIHKPPLTLHCLPQETTQNNPFHQPPWCNMCASPKAVHDLKLKALMETPELSMFYMKCRTPQSLKTEKYSADLVAAHGRSPRSVRILDNLVGPGGINSLRNTSTTERISNNSPWVAACSWERRSRKHQGRSGTQQQRARPCPSRRQSGRSASHSRCK